MLLRRISSTGVYLSPWTPRLAVVGPQPTVTSRTRWLIRFVIVNAASAFEDLESTVNSLDKFYKKLKRSPQLVRIREELHL